MKTRDSSGEIILIVEDEPAICDLCQRVLSGEGFEVNIAANGKVAQDMIADTKYDLFLVDIRMPTMSGIELYQWLEEKHSQLVSRVIFTTGSVIGGDTQSFLEQTAKPYLPKPFTPDELKDIVIETLKEMEN
jgi:DNA-binding response OmpR family regulator